MKLTPGNTWRVMSRALLCGCAPCAFAAVLAASATSNAGEWTIVPSVSLDETLSDNVDLDPEGTEEGASITSVAPRVQIQSQASRLTTSWNVGASFEQQVGGVDEGTNIRPSISGFGTLEALKNLLFFDARATVSQVLLDNEDPDAGSNQETVTNFSLGPRLVNRLGDFATSQLSYEFSKVIVQDEGEAIDDGDDISTTTVHDASLNLTSGSDFRRYLWSLSASASNSDSNDDASIVKRRDLNAGLEFIVVRTFSLIGNVGYQIFDDGNAANDVQGATWDGGFRWTPGPNTELFMTYGQRDDSNSLEVDFSHNIGPRTRLTLTYDEVLQTGEEQLLDNSSFLINDPVTGEVIDSRTGLPFDPNSNLVSSDSDSSRIRTLRSQVSGSFGRNSYRVDASLQERDEDSAVDTEQVISTGVTYRRSLSSRARISVNGRYRTTDFDDGIREDDEVSLNGQFNYRVFNNVDARTSYSFRDTSSTNAADEFTENRVSVGMTMSF